MRMQLTDIFEKTIGPPPPPPSPDPNPPKKSLNIACDNFTSLTTLTNVSNMLQLFEMAVFVFLELLRSKANGVTTVLVSEDA